MSTDLITKTFQLDTIRIVERDGEPWFLAALVALRELWLKDNKSAK